MLDSGKQIIIQLVNKILRWQDSKIHTRMFVNLMVGERDVKNGQNEEKT